MAQKKYTDQELVRFFTTRDEDAVMALSDEDKKRFLTLTAPLAKESFDALSVKELGVPQTLGGIIGAYLGGKAGMPTRGAMGGAAVADALTKYFTGEPVSAGSATFQALLEGAPAGLGKTAKKLGKNLVKGSLPITHKEARRVGGSNFRKSEGVNALTAEAIELPGTTVGATKESGASRLKDLYNQDAAAVSKAEAAGATVDIDPVIQQSLQRAGRNRVAPESQLKGELKVIEDFWDRYQPPGSSGKVKPTVAREILKETKFDEGLKSLPGASGMVTDIRKGMSQQIKRDIPELGPIMREESDLLTLLPILDTLQTQGRRVMSPEILFSGMRPKVFGIIPTSPKVGFAAGKGAFKAGQNLQQPAIPGTLRALLASIFNEEEPLVPSH